MKLRDRLAGVAATFTPLGFVAVGFAILVVVVFVGWFVTEPARQRQRAAEAHADAVIATGQTNAARDAVGVVVGNAASEKATDDLTRSNEDAIKSAPGAGQAVDPGVADAGRRALCLRKSSARDPACNGLQHPRPR